MLHLKGIEHVYPNGTRALDGVTISIGKGMFGLLGPNGSGKSSLMRTIATLQTPTAGAITFGDIDVLAQPQRLRATLGYLPQDFGVYPRVSAYDMLDHMASLKGVISAADRRATVETLLVQTNLWSVRAKAIAGFSGGMRQRFGIAQALIGNPELIIVDEPTAGLDPEERNRFYNLLVEIGENVVIILSTHIVEDVVDLCPRMAVLAAVAAGKTYADGKGNERPAQFDEQVDVGVFTARPDDAGFGSENVLSMQRVPIRSGEQEVRIVTAKKPIYAAVDPYINFIDRNTNDNIVAVADANR